jgi:hypothetical protein
MAFQPDILITTPEGMALVVETKVTLTDLKRTEQDIKEYMVRMSCPIGLLITPERMWLYRDSYTTRSPESVLRIGEFNAKPLWQEPLPLTNEAFELFVQKWLEDLAGRPTDELPQKLREALRDHILPAVVGGEVRAAHPRYS